MEYFRDHDYTDFMPCPVFARGQIYDDNVYTFDIETTSLYITPDGRRQVFDAAQPPEYYAECDKIGFMYIWQFSINSAVVYGRTWIEYQELLQAIHGNVPGTFIVYVHNLGFEFQFLRNVLQFDSVFARAPRHTMVARCDRYGIEYRCSMMLTNAALAAVPKMYDLPVKKMVGDLDYNVLRTDQTILTPTELRYCEYDCLVVYELIKKMHAEYKTIKNIPLTQTGRLRRRCQQMYNKDRKYHKWLQWQQPVKIDALTWMLQAFSGGYTHANSYYTGEIMHKVHSRDITSSYPTVMIAEKYPVSRFCDSRVQSLDDLLPAYCWIVTVQFTEIYSITENTYLSSSKATDKYHVITDNGRVVMADRATWVLTDVDIDIIKRCYRWKSAKITRAMRADKGYLDSKFIRMILTLYNNKTQYKGLPDMANEYLQSKQYINAMFGMMVTNLITDQVLYDAAGWDVHALTADEAQERLTKINEDPRTFVSQPWGIFVTAYARRNLWSMILKLDEDVIYCDTDSVKYLHDHDADFDAYNAEIAGKLHAACAAHGIDPALLSPADTHGIKHPLGVFDVEPDYTSFVTLGAKKYADTHADGKIEITISGVSKRGASALKSLKDFKKGFRFDYAHSGKKILTYNDDQQPIEVTDIQGHNSVIWQQYGINLMPTEYTIGLSEDYERYINDTLHYSGGNL